MGNIGNYIHFRVDTYFKYGNVEYNKNGKNVINDNVSNEAIEAYNRQKDRIKTMASELNTHGIASKEDRKKYCEKIEEELNYYFSGNDLSEEQQQNMDKIADDIIKEFELETTDLDRRTGYVIENPAKETKSLMDKVRKESKKLQGTDAVNHINLNTLKGTNAWLSNLYAKKVLIDKAFDSLESEQKSKHQLDAKVQAMRKLFSDIIDKDQEIKKLLLKKDSDNKSYDQLIVANRIASGEITIGQEKYNLITLINTLLDDAVLLPRTKAKQAQGKYFEDMIAMALGVGAGKAYKSIDDCLENSTKKNKTKAKLESKFLYTGNEFDTFLNQMGKGWTIKEDGQYLSYAEAGIASEGKVDVNITYDNKIAKISAKNYSLKSGKDISLVSGTNLLYLLQDEPNTDAINHYLNIINATAGGHTKRRNAYMDLKEKGYLAIAYTVLYKAIAGGTYGKNETAEIFVINDASRNKKSGELGVKAFFIQDLLDILYKDDITTFEKYAKIDANGKSLRNLSIEEKWISAREGNPQDLDEISGNQRIAKYLAQLAKAKLHASLKQSIFKEVD